MFYNSVVQFCDVQSCPDSQRWKRRMEFHALSEIFSYISSPSVFQRIVCLDEDKSARTSKMQLSAALFLTSSHITKCTVLFIILHMSLLYFSTFTESHAPWVINFVSYKAFDALIVVCASAITQQVILQVSSIQFNPQANDDQSNQDRKRMTWH